MMSDVSPSGLLKQVPLFPLPNVVLFPFAVLPLHIFEQRYRDMTRDALRGSHKIAMALLKPGWEQNYYGKPGIEPVVCVGEIISHEKLPDGKYNFLLRGTTRAQIVRECDSKLYRRANLRLLSEKPMLEIDLAAQRDQLRELFGHSPFSDHPVGREIASLFRKDVCTTAVADVIAYHYVDDVALKQQLLAEADVAQRLELLLTELAAIYRRHEARKRLMPPDPSVN